MRKGTLLTAFILLLYSMGYGQPDSASYPVSLSSLEAGVSNSQVKLKWKTICYLSYANFQIQRSTDAKNFTTIDQFSADRLRCQQPFELLDQAGSLQGKVFYRINVGDKDGNFFHSKVVQLSLNNTFSDALAAYPTVINRSTNLLVTSPIETNVTIRIVGATGIVAKLYQFKVSKGVSNLTLDLGELQKGNYWITSTNAQGIGQSVQVIKL